MVGLARFILLGSLILGVSAGEDDTDTGARQRVAGSMAPAPAVRPADEFVESVGVNIHLGHQGTGYFDDFTRVREWLGRLGVRHVRDDIVGIPELYQEDGIPARWRALGKDGIRLLLIAELAMPVTFNVEAAGMVTEALEALEGPNEYDARGGPGWHRRVRDYQRALSYEMRRRGLVVPLVAPSVAEPRNYAKVGDISAWADFANVHSYPGGRRPLHDFERHLRFALKAAPERRVVASETGYHRAVRNRDGHLPASEEAVARYLPRLLLDYFVAGVHRTYLYQFHDEATDPTMTDREQHFGLLDAQFRPKPSFHAVANLLALLADPGPRFEPVSLPVGVVADNQVRAAVFQKRNGTYYFCFWSDVESFSQRTRRTLHPPSRALKVTFGTPIGEASLYRPRTGREPLKKWKGVNVFTLEVPDEVMVLELTPTREGN